MINYKLSDLKHDLPSGLVVFFIALPLCLGLSLASNAPLFSGIIAGIVGGIVVSLISKSQLSVSGPAAGLAIIVAGAVRDLGSFEAFTVAIVLAGVLQILFGVIRAGIIAYFFPSSVIKGMLAAIGLILIIKQIPYALGYHSKIFGVDEFMDSGENGKFSMITNALEHINPYVLLITLISLGVYIFWDLVLKSKYSWFPSALVAMLTGTLFYAILELYFNIQLPDSELVSIPDTNLFKGFKFPDFSLLFNGKIIYLAFTLALLASIESLITLEAIEKIDPHKRQPHVNHELLAQGAGNIVSGLLGGLPLTALIVRSKANADSGAKTKVSAIIHGIFMILAVFLIPQYMHHVPLGVLAAVLIGVGFKLTRPAIFKEEFSLGWASFIPFAITIIATLATNLLVGILIGSIVGVISVVRTNFHSAISVEGDGEGDTVYVRLNKDVSFLNKPQLITKLNNIPKDKNVVIDGSKASFIDNDIAEVIEDFKTASDHIQRKTELIKTQYKLDSDENAFHALLDRNKEWVKQRTDLDPDYFKRMAKGQAPKFLWIGCSDSRVATDEITQTDPGEIFVHRNIANLVIKTDFNLMSVLQYAVSVLKVKHVIVCGHYECGGVKAAMGNQKLGLIDNWLSNIKDTYEKYQEELGAIEDEKAKFNRMVELVVMEQVYNLSKMSVIQEEWKNGKFPIIHGWVYDIANGSLKDLDINIEATSAIPEIYKFKI
ncbi:MAG: SulP family inorganic anion transporter [Sporocytophaga sp.]|nr:SulP family inorganic anion transporter [Sporocytophaga sp.]